MKKKILFILTCILMLIIAGCGSKNTTNNVNNENNTASETDIENAKKTNEKNHMSIEEAIQANLRYDAGSGPVLYADEDGTLYASSNTTGALKTMNTLYTSGKSSGIIKQLEIVESSALLDEEGQLFYCGDHCFPGYVITSFDMSREDERLVAVTENGSVIYCTGLCYADDRENMPVHKIPEWNSVKYVRCVEKDGVLAVNTDGTASIYAEYDDTIAKWGKFDISDWTDIEWICSFEADADQNAIIGLKSDGTLTAVGNYPEEILSWTDMVYVDAVWEKVYGIQSDGTVLCAAINDEQSEMITEMSAWKNAMIVAAHSPTVSGIAFDRTLLGIADYIYYAWTPGDAEVRSVVTIDQKLEKLPSNE